MDIQKISRGIRMPEKLLKTASCGVDVEPFCMVNSLRGGTLKRLYPPLAQRTRRRLSLCAPGRKIFLSGGNNDNFFPARSQNAPQTGVSGRAINPYPLR
jgi:hypothetical protein